jgi:ubiquinone biosynthesis protein COQ9
MNWYSKRAILAAIYTSTGIYILNFSSKVFQPYYFYFFLIRFLNIELYMTQDASPDFAGTFQFLNRRLQDSATFGSLINEINTFANFAAKSTIGILSSVSYNEYSFRRKIFMEHSN